ncbi:hypothetical protein TSOC_000704 [Tetrabaena socialis]|uniref:RAP domain-containing protein n=1 Tax=Tetrabaena socialis TaxID=47790 RepID=A0A2J8AIR3_9CHLO|nr:hypothetical protein TSOC_000704 [Tetrabaena socialis]|eukprot:PNH12398.1 hypothetical protein TSOC_000704 [Tetrabaena socialis]
MAQEQQPRDDDPQQAELLHRTLDVLAGAYLPFVPTLRGAKHCVIPLWACAKAGYWAGGGLAAALLLRLGRDGGALMRGANGQDHGNVWWSLSEAPHGALTPVQTEEVLRAGADSLLRMGPGEIGEQTCSNALLACARLRRSPTDLLHHLAACLAAPAASRQHLANSLYALGELREDCGHIPRPADLERLAAGVVRRLDGGDEGAGSSGGEGGGDRFIPQHLSNMLLGCTKLDLTDPDLLRPLAAAAGHAAERMGAQELANSLYALARLGCTGPAYEAAVLRLTAAVQQRLRHQPDTFAPQGLANMLYALVELRRERPAAAPVAALAAECRRRGFAGFRPQELSNSAWALGKMGHDGDQGWFAAAVAAALRPDVIRGFNPQDWSNIWYVLALVRHRPDPAFLESTVAASNVLRARANGQACANLLWALATLGLPYEPRLVGALVERLGELLQEGEVNAQILASSLWALAVMGPGVLFHHRRTAEALLREVVRRWDRAGALAFQDGSSAGAASAVAYLTQLWQVQQELAHAGGCGDLAGIMAAGGGDGSQGSLLGEMQRAATWGMEAAHTTSQLQQQVVSALGRLQRRLAAEQQPSGSSPILSVSEEEQVEGVSGLVDMVVELAGGRRVAVEVDGPWHFMANDPHMRAPGGATQLRDRQLARLFGAGNVVSVPYWEWEVHGAGGREEGYLLRLLGLQVDGL